MARLWRARRPPVRNDAAASKTQRQAGANPTPATQQEKQAADAAVSAQQSLDQGKTYLNTGRYQEALQEFELVRKLDPDNKDLYYLIGLTYQKMNQLEQALQAYRQCTSGAYFNVALDAVKKLEKKLKLNAR